MDQMLGMCMSAGGLVIFLYYSIWILLLPFVESSHIIQTFFLPREYAIIIPVIAGVIVLLLLSLFATYILLRKKKKKE
ncbi:dolichol phosphate-mannose biosynthesis regulatory protein-like isoform X2 [Antedon mediterranea]